MFVSFKAFPKKFPARANNHKIGFGYIKAKLIGFFFC